MKIEKECLIAVLAVIGIVAEMYLISQQLPTLFKLILASVVSMFALGLGMVMISYAGSRQNGKR